MATRELSITELRAQKHELQEEANGIIVAARTASRNLTDDENARLGEIHLRMHEINTEMAGRDLRPVQRQSRNASERFSLQRALNALVCGREQRDSEARVIEEARAGAIADTNGLFIPIENRAAVTVSGSDGVVDTDYQDILLPLLPQLTLPKAGARFMTGLRGNIAWPAYSGTTAAWAAETGDASDGGGTITSKVFKPKRLTAYVDISRQLLEQENQSVEAVLRQTLAEAVAQKIEATVFGNHTSASEMPDGLFTGFAGTAEELSWAGIVGMETECDLANALLGSLGYILHPTLVGLAKTTVKDISGAGGFVFNEGQDFNFAGLLNGYKVFRTNHMPSSVGGGYGAVFANWSDYLVAQWGSVQILVDQYTQATKGVVRLVLNSYWDLGKIRDESFVVKAFTEASTEANLD